MTPEAPRALSIRKASVKDLQEILQLFTDTILTTCSSDYTPEQLRSWAAAATDQDRWQKSITTDHFLVATAGGDLVGFASLKDHGHVDFLYVHKDHQRNGIAQQLYEALEAEALRAGQRGLTSDVSITARPFFDRQGFTVLKENINTIGEVEIINFKMEKKLV